jgi:transcription antitermination factor NusG
MDLQRFDNQWFALQVKVRSEQICAKILRAKGYEEFLPLSKFASTGNGAKALAEPKPLFPGYLFCRLTPDAKGPVVTTPGVIRVVGYGGVPSSVSDEEIAAVRTVVESGRPVYGWPFLQVGQTVRVTAGPLQGIEGTLLRFKNVRRLVVSICLLRRSAAVEIDADWVAYIAPAISAASSEPLAKAMVATGCSAGN